MKKNPDCLGTSALEGNFTTGLQDQITLLHRHERAGG
jgi:hypothetical protein